MSLCNGEASVVCLSVCPSVNFCANRFDSLRQMAGSLPNFHKMDSRSACIQDVLKVKGQGQRSRDTRTFLDSWNELGYSVIDGLVLFIFSVRKK